MDKIAIRVLVFILVLSIVSCEKKGVKNENKISHSADAPILFPNKSIYDNETLKFRVYYPSEWTPIKNSDTYFDASIPLKKGETEEDTYCYVLAHEKDSVIIDVTSFQKLYKFNMINKEKVKELQHYIYKTKSARVSYALYYRIQKGNASLLKFTYLTEADSRILELTYSSHDSDSIPKAILFFDMVNSLELQGKLMVEKRDTIVFYQRTEGECLIPPCLAKY